jgi:hypothetical protein
VERRSRRNCWQRKQLVHPFRADRLAVARLFRPSMVGYAECLTVQAVTSRER